MQIVLIPSEIRRIENELFEKLWYTRHKALKYRYSGDILSKSELFAKEIEETHGVDNLGSWTDFEWGMINGKISALRWVIEDEWGQLDSKKSPKEFSSMLTLQHWFFENEIFSVF